MANETEKALVRIDEQLKSLFRIVDHRLSSLEDGQKDHQHALQGNGQPGLKSVVRQIQMELDDRKKILDEHKEMYKWYQEYTAAKKDIKKRVTNNTVDYIFKGFMILAGTGGIALLYKLLNTQGMA